jgi:hypothetical protein
MSVDDYKKDHSRQIVWKVVNKINEDFDERFSSYSMHFKDWSLRDQASSSWH